MSNSQQKNTTKAILAVILSVIIGEGIFGFGFFWPFLLILIDWTQVYWLALAVGIIISSLYKIPVGLPSLFLVAVIGGLSFVFNSRKETGWVMLIIALLANFIFDLVFGLFWSPWEVISIVLAWFVAIRWFEKSEMIKINY